MKRYLTFFVVAVMTLGLIFLLVTKPRTAYDAPAEVPEPESADAGDDGGAGDAGAGAADGAGAAATADAGGANAAGKTIRVATLGWELAAPGVAAARAGGGAGGAAGSLAIELAPETSLEAIEARLARGSADPAGAEVAVMPLPAFVASYERIRALDPRAFLVAGFSRGREEIHAAPGALTKAPPASDEIKVVGLAPSTAADATARAGGSESATVLGLFTLDLIGVAPSRVRFVAPSAPEAKSALFAAIVRGATDERKLAFSTVDAARFVPIVAVAPRSDLEGKSAELQAFARAWLDGAAHVKDDAPGIARRLAAKDGVRLATGVGGAPEAIALVDKLGQIDEANDALEAELLLGASGAEPVTLATLAQRTWQLARGGGLTSIATPDPLPIDARVAKAVVKAPPAPASPAPAKDAQGDAGAFSPPPSGATTLLVYRAPADATAESVAKQIAFLAGVFDHAAFRVAAKGGDKAARAIAAAASEQHGVPRAHLATSPAEPAGAFATVEVLALP
jgi:hypothetical protein